MECVHGEVAARATDYAPSRAWRASAAPSACTARRTAQQHAKRKSVNACRKTPDTLELMLDATSTLQTESKVQRRKPTAETMGHHAQQAGAEGTHEDGLLAAAEALRRNLHQHATQKHMTDSSGPCKQQPKPPSTSKSPIARSAHRPWDEAHLRPQTGAATATIRKTVRATLKAARRVEYPKQNQTECEPFPCRTARWSCH